MYLQYTDGTVSTQPIRIITNHIVFSPLNKLCGFKVFLDDGRLLGDYSDYTAIYAQDDDGLYLSNDGSIRPEPSQTPDIPADTSPTVQDQIDANAAAIAELAEIISEVMT